MADGGKPAVSPALAAALEDFRQFLLCDDLQRSDAVGASDEKGLTSLADAVHPLFDEINAILATGMQVEFKFTFIPPGG